MAILTTIKGKLGNVLSKAADKGGNIVSRASGLSSAQLEKIEAKRTEYLSEKPDTDPEGIKRLLGSYSVEAYEAYLDKLSSIYTPVALENAEDEEFLKNRILYFEITKWVSDPTEDNFDKLTNMYQVLCREECNVALIFSRKCRKTKVYLAVVSTAENADTSNQAGDLLGRIRASLRGNFPGAELKDTASGILPELSSFENKSIAVVSNVASEKSEKFVSQSIEKLLDGMIPTSKNEEYTIVLLASPVHEQLEKKNALGELYSKLKPYAEWQTTFTFSETTGEGSSATFGANLGGSAGKQYTDTNSAGTNTAHMEGDSKNESATVGTSEGKTENESHSTGTGKNDTYSSGENTQKMTSESSADSKGTNISESNTNSENSSESDTDSIGGSLAGIITGSSSKGETKGYGKAITKGTGESTNHTDTQSSSESTGKNTSESHGTTENNTDTVGKALQKAKNASKSTGTGTNRSDTIGKMTQKARSVGNSLGVNFGVNFARSSNVTVFMGKNDALTQNHANFTVKNTLELIEKQIKRLEESTALGMWDFSAYFISQSPVFANNTAHMYLSLTQGDDSYISQASVNLWDKDKSNDIINMGEYLKRLIHPEFELKFSPDDEDFDESWLMYPPHINTAVSITGRELAHALNMPKKSVCGLPVLESISFGREVQKFTVTDVRTKEPINIGNIYHMRKVDTNVNVKLDRNSLCSHTFVTGSTGTGKSNFIYNMLYEIIGNEKTTFLVIEPAKGEYKKVFGEAKDVNVEIYGTNPRFSKLLRMNPFSFPSNISVLEHIDRLVEIFNACWPMYAAMPAVLKDAIERIYKDKGWAFANPEYYSKDFPTFNDLIKVLPKVLEDSLYSGDTKSDYSGALITRVNSLTNGINGEIFCSGTEISNEDLFDSNVIVDISRVGSVETKSLIMGVILMKLHEYRMHTDEMNSELKHITVIEEAHNLLRKTSYDQSQEGANLQGKSVEMLTNAIAEMRTYGEGFIIADQAPAMLDEAVIRNTNTKVVFRLPDQCDRELTGKAIALNNNQVNELAKLPAFVAAVYQNDWVEAVLCKANKFDPKEKKEYKPESEDCNLPVRKFLSFVFGIEEKISLSDVEKSYIRKWIERQDISETRKEHMLKALDGEELSDSRKEEIAYSLYGQDIAYILKKAVNIQEGLDKATQYIKDSYCFDEESIVVDKIKYYIFNIINDNEVYAEISDKYGYFGLRGGLL